MSEISEETTHNENTQKRKANATSWKKGFAPNPAGRPAAGVQSFKDRLAYWIETKTYDEIAEIISNPKKFGKLVMVDAMVAKRLHAACENGADFTAVLDRLVGKPSQAITGADGKDLIPAKEMDMHELARRTAFLLSLGSVDVVDVSAHSVALPAPPVDVKL